MILRDFISSDLYDVGVTKTHSGKEGLKSYIVENGYNALLSVNGDFSGAVHQENRWILFRDHIGVKTLYYYLKNDIFYFAEDIRELLAEKDVDSSINEKWLYLYSCGYSELSLTETEFKYVHAIRPGSWCEFVKDNNCWKMTEHIYWSPGNKRIRMKSDKQYFDEMYRLIDDAVKIRLDHFNGIVGGELSGGLDSGVVDILISKNGRKPFLVSWSNTYEDIPLQDVDERTIIEDICKQENLSYQFLPPDDTDITDAFERILPPINTDDISRTAKLVHEAGGNVVFSGHGGDEGVSHRLNIVELWHHGEYASYIKEIWNRNVGRNLRFCRSVKQIFQGIFVTLPKYKRPWYNSTDDISCCMNKNFIAKYKQLVKPESLFFAYDPAKYILQGGTRNRLDNCAVQAKDYNVRYVFPLLDYRVVDFALSIPRRLYYHNGVNRYIYREAFKEIIPKSLYELNYKDYASLRNWQASVESDKTEEEKVKEKLELVDLNLNQIDWNRWGEYFDYNTCRDMLMKPYEELPTEEQGRVDSLCCVLYTCAMVQNVQDNSSKWKNKRDKN